MVSERSRARNFMTAAGSDCLREELGVELLAG